MAGMETTVPFGVHFVCRLGKCNFYQPSMDQDGKQVTVKNLEDALAKLYI